jgi:NADP-dependent aldehyde dehydrogenase
MLTDGIAEAYRAGQARVSGAEGVMALVETVSEGRQAGPNLYVVDAAGFGASHGLAEEVFGPLGLVVRARDEAEMLAIAKGIEGQLTCTLHLDDGDHALARRLMPVLERKAGRILANGFPTGVEVADAMVHGGPYPASTNFGATSVGTLSIRRWLRPVCYQNMPDALLPADLA